MKCRKARALLPLYAGRDLPPRLEKKLEAHLQRCSVCEREKVSFEAALSVVKEAATKEERLDWHLSAWAALIERIVREKREKRLLFIAPWRWALVSGLVFCLLAIALIGIFRSAFFRAGRSSLPSAEKVISADEMPALAPQEEISPSASAAQKALPPFISAQNKKTAPATSPSVAPATLTISLVSQETGLQVIWVLNKEFDWKGVVK